MMTTVGQEAAGLAQMEQASLRSGRKIKKQDLTPCHAGGEGGPGAW